MEIQTVFFVGKLIMFIALLVASLSFNCYLAATIGIFNPLFTGRLRKIRQTSLIMIVLFSILSSWMLQTIIGINQPYIWVAIIFGIAIVHCAVYMLTDVTNYSSPV